MSLPVSVVIPTYNRAALVVRAVTCALEACREGDEIIVIDDGSIDGTEAALAAYTDRIVYARTPNGGAGKARNLGIRRARHPLVAFLDSDDAWMPGKLGLQRTLMQARPDLVFAFSNFAVRDSQGREQHNYLPRWHEDPRGWNEILGAGVAFSSLAPLPPGQADFAVHAGNLYAAEMAANYVFTSTLIVRKDVAGEQLRFAEDLPTYEDWECYGRLARVGPGAYMDCETAWQGAHGGPRLTDADLVRSSSSRLVLLERVWGSDPAFQAAHGESFRRIVREQRLQKVRGLLSSGQADEARRELRGLRAVPVSYRLLAGLPSPLVRGLAAIKRRLT